MTIGLLFLILAAVIPAAPSHLRAETAAWWRSVLERWKLDAHHILLLTACAEAWDRLQEARERLAAEGLTVATRHGTKANPVCAVERDSRVAFVRLLRELGLDAETPSAKKDPYALPPYMTRNVPK